MLVTSLPVCLFVCLFVCLLAYRKKSHVQISPKISILVNCGRGSAFFLTAKRYVCIFGFVDDVIFSYNAGIRPESKTTRMFRPLRQVAASAAKSAISNCILFANGLNAFNSCAEHLLNIWLRM